MHVRACTEKYISLKQTNKKTAAKDHMNKPESKNVLWINDPKIKPFGLKQEVLSLD